MRRNGRGRQSTGEHFIAALRCLCSHAIADGLLTDNPAARVAKPRRQASMRQAVAGDRLAQINEIVTATGNDPVLDSLLVRLHTETACRRGGALGLRAQDLGVGECVAGGGQPLGLFGADGGIPVLGDQVIVDRVPVQAAQGADQVLGC